MSYRLRDLVVGTVAASPDTERLTTERSALGCDPSPEAEPRTQGDVDLGLQLVCIAIHDVADDTAFRGLPHDAGSLTSRIVITGQATSYASHNRVALSLVRLG